jgi:hypothetical protein
MAKIHRLAARLLAGLAGESGDVPGWVLITAMTVSLVLLVWTVTSTLYGASSTGSSTTSASAASP